MLQYVVLIEHLRFTGIAIDFRRRP